MLSRCILGTSVRSLPITSIDKDLGLEKKRTSVRFFLPRKLLIIGKGGFSTLLRFYFLLGDCF